MAKPLIRKSKLEDKQAVKDAHIRSIRQICSKDYTPAQIKAWAQPAYTDDVRVRAINQQHHQVVELNQIIEGFCHSTVHDDGTGEILGLYLTPEVSGLGVGRAIAEQGLDYIKSLTPSKVVVESTITAKGFYQALGFKVLHEICDHEIRGELVKCYRMELLR